MYKANKTGLRIEPWGTPQDKVTGEDTTLAEAAES